jgi:hypothetical protein
MHPEIIEQIDELESHVNANARALAYKATAEQEYSGFIKPVISQIHEMEQNDETVRSQQLEIERQQAEHEQMAQRNQEIIDRELDPRLPPNQGGSGPWLRQESPYPEGFYQSVATNPEDTDIPEGHVRLLNYSDASDGYYPKDIVDVYLKERRELTRKYEDERRSNERLLNTIKKNGPNADSYDVSPEEYDLIDHWDMKIPIRNAKTKYTKDETDIQRIKLFTNQKLYSVSKDLPLRSSDVAYTRRKQYQIHLDEFTKVWKTAPRDPFDDQFVDFRKRKLAEHPENDIYDGRFPELYDTDFVPFSSWKGIKPVSIPQNQYIRNLQASKIIPRKK